MHRWLALLLLPGLVVAQDDMWDDEDWDDEEETQAWTGFLEAAYGTRFSSDPLVSGGSTLEDLRARVETEWQTGGPTITLKADIGFDGVEDEWIADFRDLTLAFGIGDSIDARVGRQVQTWGTGDLVFLNDLFPKDFQSFFSGREDEYLKAPGDAFRMTRYSAAINLDFVWTPVFEPNVYLTGERFSFFSPLAGGNVAPIPPLSAVRPDKDVGNGEFALRLFKTVEGREYAAYAYSGFFKDPTALNESLQPTFAPMNAIGASLRQPAGPGLFNAEFSYYDSRDDRDGTDPLIPNDQLRLLAGYEWEAIPRLTVGLQYYLEWTLDHDDLLANSPFPPFEPEERRHLITNRLTYRAGMDKYTWSLFTFWSPSDQDFYMRPAFTYRHSDEWSFTAGANLFGGSEDHTFFNQVSDGSNAYLRIRYNY